MKLHIKDEAVRRGGTPALNHSQIRNRIKRRIYFDHFEMLRVPTKSLMCEQLFRVPEPDKTRIGPTGGADKNFATIGIERGVTYISSHHILILSDARHLSIECRFSF